MTPTLVHFGTQDQPYQKPSSTLADFWGLDHQVIARGRPIFNCADTLKRAAFVLIWNGLQNQGPLVSRLCRRRGIPHAFFEYGMLDQGNHWFVDPCGFCGDSVLNGPLHWVTDEDMSVMLSKREQLQRATPLAPTGEILVPLQIHNDTQILFHTPYRDMVEFMDDVVRMFPGQRIAFRHHPKSSSRGRTPSVPGNWRMDTGSPFLAAAARASLVVGLTSTCLYEAAVLGVPVMAMGDHPLRTHPAHEHDRVAAGAFALNIPRDEPHFGPILERFGLRPLAAAQEIPA